MDEPKPERSEDAQRVLEIYNLKEYVVDNASLKKILEVSEVDAN